MPDLEISLPIKSALVWKVVEGLCRRPRTGIELAVTILRPGGGLYFCVSLVRRDRWEAVTMMNLNGTSLSITPIGEPRIRREDLSWFDAGYQAGILALGVGRMVDDIEALLGLPSWHGGTVATTPALLGIRVIAAVMQRRMFAPSATIAESGFFDSSGEDGVSVCEWVAELPGIYDVASKDLRNGNWEAAARRASRAWLLSTQTSGGRVLLDLATAEARALANDGERVQLMRWYSQNGRRLAPLVEWVVKHLER